MPRLFDGKLPMVIVVEFAQLYGGESALTGGAISKELGIIAPRASKKKPKKGSFFIFAFLVITALSQRVVSARCPLPVFYDNFTISLAKCISIMKNCSCYFQAVVFEA